MQKAKETVSEVEGEVEERALFERQVSDNFTGKVEAEEKAAWGEYVAKMETKNSATDQRSLLERHLARCHASPDAWIRYADWLVSQPTKENIRLMQKMMVESRTYLGLNSRVFLHWAELEEDLGICMAMVDKIIELVGKVHPAMMIDMTVRRANLAKKELQKVKNDKESDPSKQFPCKNCPKFFNRKDTLEKHIILLHSTSQLCTRCNKEFNDKMTLQIHQKSCSYRCSSCDKTFKHKRNLLEHMKVHSDIASK